MEMSMWSKRQTRESVKEYYLLQDKTEWMEEGVLRNMGGTLFLVLFSTRMQFDV